MSILTDRLYRTNHSIPEVCEELGIEYTEELIEDCARCDACGIWYYEYELMLDTDGLNTCRWCDENYGMKYD